MNIQNALIREHSKANTMRIVAYIGVNQERFDELMALLGGEDALIAQRAAWVVGHSGVKHPKLVQKHFQEMIDCLKKPKNHDAIKRNILRVWQFVSFPEAHIGEITDLCFDYLMSSKEAVAIKVFAMTILHNITKSIPELQNELRLLIEDQMPYGSAGFRSRGRKILKQISAS